MGEKTIRGRRRFQFEKEEERDTLEKARNYFDSTALLLNLGCGYEYRNGGSAFFVIKNGVDGGSIRTIPLETWKRIQGYASRFDRGERYDPETFKPITDI